MTLTFAAVVAVLALGYYAVDRLNRQTVTDKDDGPVDYEALIRFVEQADDAYILTHATKNIMYFSKFASSRVCNEVMEFIYRNPPKMFGARKQRQRKWSVLAMERHGATLKKTITHRPVKVKRGMKIKLGDDMVEYWDIAFTSKGFRVTAIQADSDLEKEVY